ncbi:MAG: hypothetical protein ACLR8Q_01500 [[Ruminococcus] lactaris]|uniref:hypothetical protein n=1 Tax=[Ruminococcus] lactaris TaxID=46228 RepID=UPI0039A07A5C
MTSRDMMKAIDESGIERERLLTAQRRKAPLPGAKGSGTVTAAALENNGSDESGETTGENGASREDGRPMKMELMYHDSK